MSRLRLEGIRKTYGSHVALEDVSIDIDAGAFFTLLGPSGCGKTTLLRAIAGFHRQDAGRMWIGDEPIGELPANRRRVGMVFQDYAVFPHLSVFDNVAFGLRQQKVPAAELRERVDAMLATVQLAALAARMPHQLSGGQQQRVGLARALVIRPRVLLMDEPLSNLDAKLRVDLRRDIRALQQQFGITTVYVTHDQEEALSLSDRICVMHGGRAQQIGTPWQIYHEPANRFVASFVGANNFLPVRAAGRGEVELLGRRLAAPLAAPCVAAVRPESVALGAPAGEGIEVEGVLRQAMFGGRELQLTVEVPGHAAVDALVEPNAATVALKPGDAVRLGIAARDLRYYADGEVGRALAAA